MQSPFSLLTPTLTINQIKQPTNQKVSKEWNFPWNSSLYLSGHGNYYIYVMPWDTIRWVWNETQENAVVSGAASWWPDGHFASNASKVGNYSIRMADFRVEYTYQFNNLNSFPVQMAGFFYILNEVSTTTAVTTTTTTTETVSTNSPELLPLSGKRYEGSKCAHVLLSL